MSKHTPGPWEVRIREPWVIAKAYGDMKSVFHINHPAEPSETQMANAYLIAAAPDLLEALERTLSWLSSYPGGCAENCYSQAKAALAKAKGESNE